MPGFYRRITRSKIHPKGSKRTLRPTISLPLQTNSIEIQRKLDNQAL